MTRAFVLLAVAAAVSVTSCRTKPEVSVRATSALSYRELIDKSPVIVVGKVAAVKVVVPRSERPMRTDMLSAFSG
jgi:hypothetical protein